MTDYTLESKIDKLIQNRFIPFLEKAFPKLMKVYLLLAIPFFIYVLIQFLQMK